VADLPELDRDEGLVELEKLSLVNKKKGRFELLPLTLVYSQTELMKVSEFEALLKNKWVEFFLNFLIRESPNKYESLERVEPEIDNILTVMDWCWLNNRLEMFITFAEMMNFYLWVTGKWGSWEKYIRLGLQVSTSLDKALEQARFLRRIAEMKQFQGNLDKAESFAQKAIKSYQLHGNKNELARSTAGLASIQIELDEYETAKKNLIRL